VKPNEIEPGIYIGTGKRGKVCRIVNSSHTAWVFGLSTSKNRYRFSTLYNKMEKSEFRRWLKKFKAVRVY